jgi:nucleotide-binding universal stress UspA family protein
MAEIVVGVDGSPGAAEALRWAVREGRVRSWPVTAVMAWGYLDQHHVDPTAPFDPAYDQAHADAALEAYVTAALGPDDAAGVGRRPVAGLSSAALIEAAADASLLVVGARGLGGFRELLLGSVSQQCVHHAPCPVAVVRPTVRRVEPAVERIVVGVDGSGAAQRALAWAVDEGRARGATVEAVHAWHMPYVGLSPYAPVAADPAIFEEAGREVLQRAVDRVDARGLPAPVERILAAGGAASVLLEAAKGADLVVVGTRGRGGFAGLVLGSVSHQVTHHAECPVVVVRDA